MSPHVRDTLELVVHFIKHDNSTAGYISSQNLVHPISFLQGVNSNKIPWFCQTEGR